MEQNKLGILYASLAKVQAQLRPAKRENENPYFKSKYADLSSVWDACRDLLSKNGLCIVQTPGIVEGVLMLKTTLGHESGASIESYLPLTFGEKITPQTIGSAVTYMRRYALMSIVGIAAEDDDAETVEKAARISNSPRAIPVQGRLSANPNDYTPNFGKYKGIKFTLISREERDSYSDYLSRDKNSAHPLAVEFIAMNEALNKLEDSKVDDIKF